MHVFLLDILHCIIQHNQIEILRCMWIFFCVTCSRLLALSKNSVSGFFAEKCEDKDDGLYYVDDTTFAFCHNGEKTIQPCAEGSINPPIENFQEGRYYGLYDFCSVNINQFLAPGYGGFPRYNQERPANEYLEDTKY